MIYLIGRGLSEHAQGPGLHPSDPDDSGDDDDEMRTIVVVDETVAQVVNSCLARVKLRV